MTAATPNASGQTPRSPRSAASGELRRRLARTSLTSSWLGARLGIGPSRVELMRRSGELLGARLPDSYEYIFPAWQFGPDGKPRASVAALVAEARSAGLDDLALCELMERRVGLGGSKRLADVFREGGDAHVREAIRSVASSR